MVRRKKNTMLKVEEVARTLNLHVTTVRRWSNKGILKTYRIGPRGDRRYQYSDVINLVKEQRSMNTQNRTQLEPKLRK